MVAPFLFLALKAIPASGITATEPACSGRGTRQAHHDTDCRIRLPVRRPQWDCLKGRGEGARLRDRA